jgi:hypothetical protein
VSLRPPGGRLNGPEAVPGVQRDVRRLVGPGFENHWKAEYLADLPDACLDVFAEFAVRHTSPLSDFKIVQLGGAVARR